MTAKKHRLLLFILIPAALLVLGMIILQHTDIPRRLTVWSYVRDDLHLNLSGGEVTRLLDSHRGFHGDGKCFIEIHYTDKHIEKMISQYDGWQSLPLNQDVQTLVYDGYFIEEDGQNPLVPKIVHGYYYLVDRQSEREKNSILDKGKEPGIFNRYSINLTVGLYDSDHDILYVLALDT